ncbi:hypothetical protein Tco_0775518 [Tanacetum coccineum]
MDEDVNIDVDTDFNEFDKNIIANSMAALPLRDHRHLWLRYEGLKYTDGVIEGFETRMDTIFSRQINRVHVLDFDGLTREIRARHNMTLRKFILVLGLHIAEEMARDGFEAYWVGSLREIASKGDLSDYLSRIASDGDFLEVVPSYTSIRDPLWRICHRLIAFSILGRGQAPEKVTATDLFYLKSMDDGTTVNVPYLLAQYLFRHTKGSKRGARMSSSHFFGRLAVHFGLVTDEGLRELTMVVAPGLERQQVAVAGDAQVDLDVAEEGVLAVPAPAQALPAAP